MKKSEIATAIIDTILEDNILNRESLSKRIEPILAIWIRESKIVKVPLSEQKTLDKMKALKTAVDRQNYEKQFGLDELRRLKTPEEMATFFNNSDENLISKGFK